MQNWSRIRERERVISHNLFEEIISLENLFSAWREFCRGKRKKLEVQHFEYALEDNLLELQMQLREGSYRVAPYESFYITDPKLRHIHKASVRDRVLFQAVYRVLAPVFEKQFIFDSFSSRLGKGTHAGVDRLERFLVKASANGTRPAYALKGDIRKFFDSIDHQTLLNLLRLVVADGSALRLLENVVCSFSVPYHSSCDRTNYDMRGQHTRGLPLGNVTSQLFANIYLHQLDFFVKHVLRIRYYARYCDDFVIISDSTEKFSEYLTAISEFLQTHLKLGLHPNKIEIKKYSQGVDFLGYVLRPHHRLLRTKTKQRLLRRINKKNAPSYYGVLTHADTKKLRAKFDFERILG